MSPSSCWMMLTTFLLYRVGCICQRVRCYVARVCCFGHCGCFSAVGQPIWNRQACTFPGKLVTSPFSQCSFEQVTNANGSDTWRAFELVSIVYMMRRVCDSTLNFVDSLA